MKYIIFTDGACSGNPGPGGWGAVIIDEKENQINLSGKVLKAIVSVQEMYDSADRKRSEYYEYNQAS